MKRRFTQNVCHQPIQWEAFMMWNGSCSWIQSVYIENSLSFFVWCNHINLTNIQWLLMHQHNGFCVCVVLIFDFMNCHSMVFLRFLHWYIILWLHSIYGTTDYSFFCSLIFFHDTVQFDQSSVPFEMETQIDGNIVHDRWRFWLFFSKSKMKILNIRFGLTTGNCPYALCMTVCAQWFIRSKHLKFHRSWFSYKLLHQN